MPPNKNTAFMRWPFTSTRAWALAVMVVASTGLSLALVIPTAFSATKRGYSAARMARSLRVEQHFGVFRHPLRRAHVASTLSPRLPANAVVAAVVGDHELAVFVGGLSQHAGRSPATEELCISDLEANGGGGLACANPTAVEREGMVLETAGVRSSSIAILVPNGVSSVSITDNNSALHELSVSNNVAMIEDSNASTVSYVMPNGAQHTQRISGPAQAP